MIPSLSVDWLLSLWKLLISVADPQNLVTMANVFQRKPGIQLNCQRTKRGQSRAFTCISTPIFGCPNIKWRFRANAVTQMLL
jgi:hypothetical protein